ncbi:hypothetical protein [Sinorhizobium fredii]|uniref:hypothetical protein n=1 Tax=Rhizobium fredii TaxID=380 RepID=UPI00351605F4
MSIEYERIKSQVRAEESRRPAADVDAEGHKEANDRITRLIDTARMFADASRRAGKVPL